ncbi:hypothetical protein [Helicobacter sp. T3_23-1056]
MKFLAIITGQNQMTLEQNTKLYRKGDIVEKSIKEQEREKVIEVLSNMTQELHIRTKTKEKIRDATNKDGVIPAEKAIEIVNNMVNEECYDYFWLCVEPEHSKQIIETIENIASKMITNNEMQ